MQNLFIFDQRRSNTLNHKHKRYRRPKVRSVASSVHGPLREQLRPCGRRARFLFFTRLTTANHVRVTSAGMPYHGAKFHGRGLKIRLCGLPVSTGALNAVEIYVKKREKFFRKMLETYSKSTVSMPRSRKLPCWDPP